MTTAQTTSAPEAPTAAPVLSEEEKAKLAARNSILSLPNHLFLDLGGDFRATYYSNVVIPSLSKELEEIRKTKQLDVTEFLSRSTSSQELHAISRSTKPLRPSFRSATLVRKSGYFVVLRNGEFNYFRCLAQPHGDYLFKMVDPAPILSEGVFILNKEIYFVTEQDLRKGIVRKARQLNLKRSAITYADITTNNVFPASRNSGPHPAGAETGAIPNFSAATPGTIQDPDDTGSLSASELAERQAIDLAFDEQVRELLGASSEEEIEWQASENS